MDKARIFLNFFILDHLLSIVFWIRIFKVVPISRLSKPRSSSLQLVRDFHRDLSISMSFDEFESIGRFADDWKFISSVLISMLDLY